MPYDDSTLFELWRYQKEKADRLENENLALKGRLGEKAEKDKEGKPEAKPVEDEHKGFGLFHKDPPKSERPPPHDPKAPYKPGLRWVKDEAWPGDYGKPRHQGSDPCHIRMRKQAAAIRARARARRKRKGL